MQAFVYIKQSSSVDNGRYLGGVHATVSMGQMAPAKKSYTFQGKVEAIDESAKSLKMNGEKVEGWMDAMAMAYKVDDAAILKR